MYAGGEKRTARSILRWPEKLYREKKMRLRPRRKEEITKMPSPAGRRASLFATKGVVSAGATEVSYEGKEKGGGEKGRGRATSLARGRLSFCERKGNAVALGVTRKKRERPSPRREKDASGGKERKKGCCASGKHFDVKKKRGGGERGKKERRILLKTVFQRKRTTHPTFRRGREISDQEKVFIHFLKGGKKRGGRET